MVNALEPRSLNFLAAACGGRLMNAAGESVASSLVTDSRRVGPKDVFLAIKGERFDAHDFVAEVFSRGAVAAVVASEKLSIVPAGKSYVAVDNPRLALGEIAARYRKDFNPRCIAVGGSNGKTSTKEILASMLGVKFRTVASEGSFNNDIGVPLTILRLDQSHQVAIFEVGSNHPGELEPLVEMVQPEIGIITSIGREHLEFFGSTDGVVEEEGKLAEKLPSNGTLLLNGDSQFANDLAGRTRAKVTRVGFGESNDVQISETRMDASGATFSVRFGNSELESYRTNFIGKHQAINAAYAVVVGKELGMGRLEIQDGLDRCPPAKMRLERVKLGEILIINDAYNANPDSMAMALETLRDFPTQGRKIAVLGDMAELGKHSEEAHVEAGAKAALNGIDILIAVGERSRATAEAALRSGCKNVRHCLNAAEGGAALAELVQPGDVALIKASRSSKLEAVIPVARERLGFQDTASECFII